MIWLIGFITLYLVIGLIVVPYLDNTKPTLDLVNILKSVSWAFTWPMIVWGWWKLRKERK